MVSGNRTKKVNDIPIEDFEWFDDEEEILPQPSSLSVGIVLPDGSVEHRNEAGQLHRLDGPAIEAADGTKEWFQNGLRHRLDGPAFEGANGTKGWYQNGIPHRLDGPAIEWADGDKWWFVNGARRPDLAGK